LDKQSFRDFVADMTQYLDGQWSIEEREGYDYLKLRGEGPAILNVYNTGDRISVSGQFELFGDWQQNDQIRRCFVKSEDNVSTSHPTTSARRAAARVNAMLPDYYAALERVMERYRRHEQDLATARRNAGAIVKASNGVLEVIGEKYDRGRVHVRGYNVYSSESRAPGSHVEFEVDDQYIHVERWDMPPELAITIAEWMGQHRNQPK
jgi:hypothetical protein